MNDPMQDAGLGVPYTEQSRHDSDGRQQRRDLAMAVAMVAAAIAVVVFTPEIVGWILGAL